MRAEALSPSQVRAARELLGVYERLAARGAHLLGNLLRKDAPQAWARLPSDDAVDRGGRFQWFYHSHGPDDGRGGTEHGHFHLFARRSLWERLAGADAAEDGVLAELAGSDPDAETRHLLAISMDAKGVPVGFFATDPRVTGDAILSAATTLEALRRLELDTRFPEIDRLIESLIALCLPEVEELLAGRNKALRLALARGAEPSEVLSEAALDLDSKLASASRQPDHASEMSKARRSGPCSLAGTGLTCCWPTAT